MGYSTALSRAGESVPCVFQLNIASGRVAPDKQVQVAQRETAVVLLPAHVRKLRMKPACQLR